MPDKEGLKPLPCPFGCDSKPYAAIFNDGTHIAIFCPICGTEGPIHSTEPAALAAWNSRPADSPKAAKVEDEYEGDTAKGWYEAWTRENDAWQKMVQHHEELEDVVKNLCNITAGENYVLFRAAREKVRQILEVKGSAPATLQPKPEAKEGAMMVSLADGVRNLPKPLLNQASGKITPEQAQALQDLFEAGKRNIVKHQAQAALTPSPKDASLIRVTELLNECKEYPRGYDYITDRINEVLGLLGAPLPEALAPQAEPIGEREDGTMAPQIGDKQ